VETVEGVENPHTSGDVPTTADDASNPHADVDINPLTDENGDLLQSITVSGQLINQSDAANTPANVPVVLHVVDASFNEELIEGETDADGRYVFDDIPYTPQMMYVVTTTYSDNFFRSDITRADANPLAMDIPVYDAETDASVLSITQMMFQIDRLQNGDVHVFQRVHVNNSGNSMYMTDNGSVRIPLPEGAQPSQNLETNRYDYDPDANVLIDTNGARPGEHVSVVSYVIPQPDGDTLNLSQTFNYPAQGMMVIFADANTMTLPYLQAAGDVQNDGRTLTHYTGEFNLEAGQPLTLTVESVDAAPVADDDDAGLFSVDTLAYGLMILGVVAVAFGVTSFLFRDTDSTPTDDDPTDRIESLMARITALDERFEKGDIEEAAYQKQRKRLKAELAQLMG
jgi:hypothetical protein